LAADGGAADRPAPPVDPCLLAIDADTCPAARVVPATAAARDR